MTVHLTTYHPHQIIKELALKLDTTSKVDCLEEIIELPKEIGEGRIVGFSFSDGVGMLVFDCVFKEDIEFVYKWENRVPLQLHFNVAGGFQHNFGGNRMQYYLNPLQGSVTANESQQVQRFKFSSNVAVVYNTILIDRDAYYDKVECIFEKMPPELVKVFSDLKGEDLFYYHSNYSIAASEIITKIIKDDNEGLVRSAFLEAKALELISKLIKQYKDDLMMPTKQLVIRKYDLDKIRLARQKLFEDIQNAPTIEELAGIVGINQQKLKMGYKIVYGNTINKSLREERMERASLLLITGMSVKQVAYEVGYSNQSHFSARFKEKYGVLPKDYLKTIRSRLEN